MQNGRGNIFYGLLSFMDFISKAGLCESSINYPIVFDFRKIIKNQREKNGEGLITCQSSGWLCSLWTGSLKMEARHISYRVAWVIVIAPGDCIKTTHLLAHVLSRYLHKKASDGCFCFLGGEEKILGTCSGAFPALVTCSKMQLGHGGRPGQESL